MAPATEEDGGPGSVSGAWPSAVKSRIGTVIANTYRLTRPIGSGGSSHVFEAEHLRLGKLFAVKLLRPDLDPARQTAQRFRREARAIARLSSEHIVSVVDCGELDDGTPYLVMELLQGEDLRSLLRREGSLPARRAVPIAIDACRALAEAHAAGLVHRDLKPENLFITRRATGEDWCKVLDFGVAKMDASMSTTEGAIVGTVRYMAPEQLADGAQVGTTTDIYALGAILYECLSGRPAHAGDSIQEVMFSVLNKEPRPLENVPEALTMLTLGCLSKDSTRRPSSAQALEQMLGTTVSLSADATAERTITEDDGPDLLRVRRARTRPASLLLLPVALGALVSLVAVGWFWSNRSQERTSPAVPPIPAAAAQPTSHEPSQTSPTPVAMTMSALPSTSPSPAQSTSKSRQKALPRNAAGRAPDAPLSSPPVAARAPAIGSLDPANPYPE